MQKSQNHRLPDGSVNGKRQQNQVGSSQSAAPMDFTCQQDGWISMHIVQSNDIHQNNGNNGWLLSRHIRDSGDLAPAIHDVPVGGYSMDRLNEGHACS